MIARFLAITLLVLALPLIGGCGDTSPSSNGSVADGGISGTGEGTVTGYGSIIINDTRHFEIAGGTTLFLDDAPISESDLLARAGSGLGFVGRVDVGDDVNADFTSGTAVVVDLEHQVKGPVTSVAPLEVLGQPIFTTGDTVLANVADIGDLVVGDLVEVSGSAGVNNAIQATRIELQLAIPVWKLIGIVTSVGAGTLNIGSQLVDISTVTADDCGGPPAVDDLVEIKADHDPGFTPGGDTLDTVTKVECRNPGLPIPPGMTGGTLLAEIEGIVDSILVAGPPPTEFTVRGQEVHTTGSTVYEGGDAEDIDLGVKLEAEGTLDVATGILTAKKIRFRNARVRMEAPATAATAGQSVVVLGLTVQATPLTEDDDNIILNGSSGMQVEVRGFVDSAGTIFGTRIRDRGIADNTDVRLRGPLTAVPADPNVEILGITVDTTGAAFQDETGGSIDATLFFGTVGLGSQVDVEGGTFDTVDTITGAATISIED